MVRAFPGSSCACGRRAAAGRRRGASALLVALLAIASVVVLPQREAHAEVEGRSLRVGVKEAPPFAIRSEDGAWSGIAVDLWRRVADELALPYAFEERDLETLLSDVERGRLDAGIGALTVTAEREARFDFTHPFHTSGLGVAVERAGRAGLLGVLQRAVSWEFVNALGALAAVLLLVGTAVWLFERRRNASQFGGATARGIGSGFWWAAVTMTTVGYGDKAPVTLGGRAVGLVWMFVSVVTISSFTAAIATTLTVSRLSSLVQDAGDLARVRVGAASATTGAGYLESRGIRFLAFPGPEAALEALAAGRIDAVVHDAPVLQHSIESDWLGQLELVPIELERQDYALALPPDDPDREAVNRALLEVIGDPGWHDVLRRYLGE